MCIWFSVLTEWNVTGLFLLDWHLTLEVCNAAMFLLTAETKRTRKTRKIRIKTARTHRHSLQMCSQSFGKHVPSRCWPFIWAAHFNRSTCCTLSWAILMNATINIELKFNSMHGIAIVRLEFYLGFGYYCRRSLLFTFFVAFFYIFLCIYIFLLLFIRWFFAGFNSNVLFMRQIIHFEFFIFTLLCLLSLCTIFCLHNESEEKKYTGRYLRQRKQFYCFNDFMRFPFSRVHVNKATLRGLFLLEKWKPHIFFSCFTWFLISFSTKMPRTGMERFEG